MTKVMSSMKFRSVSLKNYKCFDDVALNFERKDSSIYQWTILLGNNNTGKTNLLKAIANLRPAGFKFKEKQGYVPAGFLDKARDRKGLSVSCITTERSLRNWRYTDNSASGWSEFIEKPFHIFAYGVTRYPSNTSLSESKVGPCDTLFHTDKRLVNIEEWLMQLDYASKNNNVNAASRLVKIKELINGTLFPEILDFKFESSDSLHNYVLFKTKDGWFRYNELGFGYQSSLSWIIDLSKRLFEAYPESENPLAESAVVLIDEIDLHLHPRWQRDIVGYLSKAFPGIQFIASTHSPSVLQSMSDVNLYVMTRKDGKVMVKRSPLTDFNGWSVEEILRDVMEMNDDIYSDAFQEYMRLFDAGLDQDDKNKAKVAYEELLKILHPDNPLRRMLEIQYKMLIK
ncbi:MAG: AAA family ATPase [Lachnospiraceae bacterium]|nr:AAA family ATPase [Lachnospiraceae bacterium]